MKLPALSWWLLGYGAFVFTMGVLGYLSNPEKAGTALAVADEEWSEF